MKLMHISDLHIGKKIMNISMKEEQRDVLNKILEIVRTDKPDAVLIAGDVYDKPTPSDEAVEMLDDFLYELSKTDSKIFIIAGNHDSAERVAFLNRIVSDSGIHIAPVYRGDVKPVTLTDEYGPVNIYMLPFIKPLHVRYAFSDEAENIKTHTDAVGLAIEKMNIDKAQRNVLLSHQYVTGASTTDSEMIGGLDNVEVSAYEGFDYVALGHIHRPQDIPASNHIRYCGTPLKYSFSEANDEKSVTMIELGQKGDVEISTIPLPAIRDFIRVENDFETIRREFESAPTDDYVEVTLTNEETVPDAFRRLQKYMPRIMTLKYNNLRYSENMTISKAADTEKLSDMEIMERLFLEMNNQPLSDEQREYMEALINKVQEGMLNETN